jgi:hypothetical protein
MEDIKNVLWPNGFTNARHVALGVVRGVHWIVIETMPLNILVLQGRLVNAEAKAIVKGCHLRRRRLLLLLLNRTIESSND